MNLYTSAESNILRTWLYLTGFLVLVIGIGWLISYLMGSPGILLVAVFVSVFMSLGSFWYSDKIVLAMTRAKPAPREGYEELHRIVENLSITAGLPAPKIYIIEDSQPNAFATGRSAKKGVVAVTTGLLERLNRTELQGVLGHELSHIGNKDMLISAIVVVLVGFVTLLVNFFFRMTLGGGFRGSSDRKSQANAVMFAIGIALMILAPILAKLLQLAISRKREFLADASGALLTRYPEGLASALEKIASHPTQLKTANDATAHLYIASPFRGGEAGSWIHKLFMTHPPIGDRIRALRGMEL
ncbi:MAG: M48 family metallopeptidase [Candidatus Wildermuthbacteria bacterium]|nr:M48 family metallopeptidase [Candidatus Wildermuthbacteria bacterium]